MLFSLPYCITIELFPSRSGSGIGSFPLLPQFLFSSAALLLAPSFSRSPGTVASPLSFPTRGGEDQLLWLRMSTEGHRCEWNTNRNPQFGVLWRRKLYPSQTAQLWYSMTFSRTKNKVDDIPSFLHQQKCFLSRKENYLHPLLIVLEVNTQVCYHTDSCCLGITTNSASHDGWSRFSSVSALNQRLTLCIGLQITKYKGMQCTALLDSKYRGF